MLRKIAREALLRVPAVKTVYDERSELKRSVDAITRSNEALVAQNQTLEATIADLRQEVERLAVGNADLRQEVERLAIQNEQLATQSAQFRLTLEQADIPLPPPQHLQRRVVGTYVDRFVTSANRTLQEFDEALQAVGVELASCRDVLDFGVGCGRVLRRFAELNPATSLVGGDIDPEAIAWLQENYSPRFGRFVLVPHRPPVDIPDNTFDLIYSISVFTHLDEEMQFQWLADLHRLAKPGGHLLLTVHGENYIELFPEDVQNEIRAKGIYYNRDSGLTEGLPDFYKNTYHKRAYVEREWAKYFEILSYIPMGNENHQDLIVCRKRI